MSKLTAAEQEALRRRAAHVAGSALMHEQSSKAAEALREAERQALALQLDARKHQLRREAAYQLQTLADTARNMARCWSKAAEQERRSAGRGRA
jgi:hypothetical protein